MDVYLKQNDVSFQFPVPPESFEISTGKLNTTVVLENFGEVNILGKGRLDSISISSFFPNQKYDFYKCEEFIKPYDCIKIVKEIMKKGQVRLMLTDTDINKIFYIENFSYGERDGTGDVYFTMEFREFKKVTTTVKALNGGRDVNKVIPKTYVVKLGDNLRKIAKWWYGDFNKADYLAKKNGIKNSSNIKVGTVLYL